MSDRKRIYLVVVNEAAHEAAVDSRWADEAFGVGNPDGWTDQEVSRILGTHGTVMFTCDSEDQARNYKAGWLSR